MTSDRIAQDYLRRARTRRLALDTFLAAGVHGDVLALRFVGVDPPKRHDVHDIVGQFLGRLPAEWAGVVGELRATLSRLAEERSRAFYGDEATGTPSSELYGPDEARRAVDIADRLLAMYGRLLGEAGSQDDDQHRRQ